jgi:hypothetical protein
VSCLAEQAKILVAEALENNLGAKALIARWERWETCSLCKQEYHGVVACALGWACWIGDGATLDDLREAVATLEDTARIARRVLGGSHPTTSGIEGTLRKSREALRARETPSSPSGSA